MDILIYWFMDIRVSFCVFWFFIAEVHDGVGQKRSG
jgi:hypothetical protein